MEISIINCFCTNKKNSGNPAAVVSHFNKNKDEKQKLARELNLPVTVFIADSTGETCKLEFFYPEIEMPLCLHGMLGAAFTLLKDTASENLTCTTKEGNRFHTRNENNIIQVLVSRQQVPHIPLNKNEICKMLNLESIEEIQSEFPLTVSSVGSPKLLVPLKSFALLSALNPNFELIEKWSRENRVNGLYVYTNDSPNSSLGFYARGFNPRTGHNEDAATGVAAAALALTLKQSIIVGQGLFMKRESEISVSYANPENVWVGGRAVLISELE
jgi:trans-2,3-dihydro-3-hydroxyanthranilate isomerase